MNKEILLADLEQATNRLVEVLFHFTSESFMEKPANGGWSAAEITDHLLKVETTANAALRSKSVPTTRPPDSKIAFIKEKMEDETKREAPEPLRPSSELHDIFVMLGQLRRQRDELAKAIEQYDETEACIGQKHPALGTLTRMEWIYFIIYHADRHLRQLKKLQTKLAF